MKKYITIINLNDSECRNIGTVEANDNVLEGFKKAVESHFCGEMQALVFETQDAEDILDCIMSNPIDVTVEMNLDGEEAYYYLELSETWLYPGEEPAGLPNGFDCWVETYYEIVSAIEKEMQKDEPSGIARLRHDSQGHGGLYDLAKELTNKFEALNAGRVWDGDFPDAIEAFIQQNLHLKDAVKTPACSYMLKLMDEDILYHEALDMACAKYHVSREILEQEADKYI